MSRGNTTIVAPGGEILEGPLLGATGTVTATLDLDRIATGRRTFDPTGHYARPDILQLTITEPPPTHEHHTRDLRERRTAANRTGSSRTFPQVPALRREQRTPGRTWHQ